MYKRAMNPQVAPQKTIRVGLIGWGGSSQVFHGPLIMSTPGLHLVAVVSSRPDAIHAALGPGMAVEPDAGALLARDDIDLVVIPTPNDSHHPLALAALQAGRAVVVDKPFTLNAAQAEQLIAAAQERGLLLSVFHNRRWDGDMLTAQALVQSGQLGRLVHAQMHFDRFRPVVPARWRDADGPGAGLWMDLGPHLLDQAMQLFGRPVAISADLVTTRDSAQATDMFHARLRWASGLRADLHGSALSALPGPRFALHGTRGSWVKSGLDRQEDALKAGQRPDAAHPQAWGHDPAVGRLAVLAPDAPPNAAPMEQDWPTAPGRYSVFYAGIRDALWGLTPNPVPATQALDVMRLLDLGAQSAAQRRELPVPDAAFM